MALDYIIRKQKLKKIPEQSVALICKSIEKRIFSKYIEAKYDSELLDLIEFYDVLNGVVN